MYFHFYLCGCCKQKKGRVLSPGSYGLRVFWRTSNVIPYRCPHGYISTPNSFYTQGFGTCLSVSLFTPKSSLLNINIYRLSVTFPFPSTTSAGFF